MRRCCNCFSENEDVFTVCAFCGSSVGCPADKSQNPLCGITLHKRYFVGKPAGSGGFGFVYRGFDTLLSKKVAIKEFYPSKLANRGENGISVLPLSSRNCAEFLYRKKSFLREASISAECNNCRFFPKVFDFFEENGTAYIIMEFLDGKTLAELSGTISMDEASCVRIAADIAGGIAILHSYDIIHRDVSPDNVLICENNGLPQIKILDFGGAISSNEMVTKNDIIYKKGYSAPEMTIPSEISKSCDVYSIGMILASLLSGVDPSSVEGISALKMLKMSKERISPKLAKIILKATCPSPRKRYSCAIELRDALNDYKNRNNVR